MSLRFVPASDRPATPPPKAVDRALFAAYVGPNAERFLPALEHVEGQEAGREPDRPWRALQAFFCWPGLLMPLPWAMYRRLWGLAGFMVLLAVVTVLTVRASNLGYLTMCLWLGALGKQGVAGKAQATIRRLAALEPDPERLRERVARAGGVSRVAWFLGLLVTIAPLVPIALDAFGAPVLSRVLPPAEASGRMSRLGNILVVIALAAPLALLLAGLSARRSPPRLLRTAFLMGTLAAVGSLWSALAGPLAAQVAPGLARAALEAFLGAAIPEEVAKLVLLTLVVLREPDARPARDAPLAGAWLGLGFGVLESLFFAVGRAEMLEVAAARAVTAVPFHVALGLIMGGLIAASRGGRVPWAALAIPTLLHGAYNWALLATSAEAVIKAARDPIWLVAISTVLAATWLALRLVVGPLARAEPFAEAARGRWTDRVIASAPVVAILLALLGGGFVATSLAKAAFVDPSRLGLAVYALMPLAFADLWRRVGPALKRDEPAGVPPAREIVGGPGT